MLQHGVENSQQLMHARRQGDFFDFPRREEPFVKDFDLRVETCRHERAHVQYGAHMRAASPNAAPASQGPLAQLREMRDTLTTAGAILAGFLGWKLGRAFSHTVTIASVAISFAASVAALLQVMDGAHLDVFTAAQRDAADARMVTARKTRQ